MQRSRTTPIFANKIGAIFVIFLILVAVIGGFAYGDMRVAQSGERNFISPTLMGGLVVALLVLGGFLAFYLRQGLLSRSQIIADKIFMLSRGEVLDGFSEQEEKVIDPQILSSLRLVSDQLKIAARTKQDEKALLRSAEMHNEEMDNFRYAMEDVFTKAADGDFSARLLVPENRPELNDFCGRINGLLGAIQASFTTIKTTMGLIAKGELHKQVEQSAKGDFQVLLNDMNQTLNSLIEFVGDLKSSETSIVDATKRIDSGSHALSVQISEQSHSLSEASTLMDQISNSISESTQKVTQADLLTNTAASQAEDGSNVVSDAISAMERIEGNSDRISDIISVIEGIAFQTNLLALNAAVEAARAGDAGKGFAVVASEVRNLAQRASDAAKDITDLIQQSSGDVENGVRLVKQSGNVLNEIADSVRQVASAMSELNEAGENQASSVTEVTDTIKALDSANSQSVNLAQEASLGTQSLKKEASRLTFLANRFSGEQAQDQDWIALEKSSEKTERPKVNEPVFQAIEPPFEKVPVLAKDVEPKRLKASSSAAASAISSSADWSEF